MRGGFLVGLNRTAPHLLRSVPCKKIDAMGQIAEPDDAAQSVLAKFENNLHVGTNIWRTRPCSSNNSSFLVEEVEEAECDA